MQNAKSFSKNIEVRNKVLSINHLHIPLIPSHCSTCSPVSIAYSMIFLQLTAVISNLNIRTMFAQFPVQLYSKCTFQLQFLIACGLIATEQISQLRFLFIRFWEFNLM